VDRVDEFAAAASSRTHKMALMCICARADPGVGDDDVERLLAAVGSRVVLNNDGVEQSAAASWPACAEGGILVQMPWTYVPM